MYLFILLDTQFYFCKQWRQYNVPSKSLTCSWITLSLCAFRPAIDYLPNNMYYVRIHITSFKIDSTSNFPLTFFLCATWCVCPSSHWLIAALMLMASWLLCIWEAATALHLRHISFAQVGQGAHHQPISMVLIVKSTTDVADGVGWVFGCFWVNLVVAIVDYFTSI